MRVDGLWHVDLKPSQQRQVCVVLLDERGYRDGRQIPRVMPIVAHLSNQVEAVLVRHTQVADEHVWARRGERLYRLADAARRSDDGADAFEHHDQDPPGVGVVIDNEHAQPIETDQRKTAADWDGMLGCPFAGITCDRPLFTLFPYPHRADGKANGKRRTFAFARAVGFDLRRRNAGHGRTGGCIRIPIRVVGCEHESRLQLMPKHSIWPFQSPLFAAE